MTKYKAKIQIVTYEDVEFECDDLTKIQNVADLPKDAKTRIEWTAGEVWNVTRQTVVSSIYGITDNSQVQQAYGHRLKAKLEKEKREQAATKNKRVTVDRVSKGVDHGSSGEVLIRVLTHKPGSQEMQSIDLIKRKGYTYSHGGYQEPEYVPTRFTIRNSQIFSSWEAELELDLSDDMSRRESKALYEYLIEQFIIYLQKHADDVLDVTSLEIERNETVTFCYSELIKKK